MIVAGDCEHLEGSGLAIGENSLAERGRSRQACRCQEGRSSTVQEGAMRRRCRNAVVRRSGWLCIGSTISGARIAFCSSWKAGAARQLGILRLFLQLRSSLWPLAMPSPTGLWQGTCQASSKLPALARNVHFNNIDMAGNQNSARQMSTNNAAMCATYSRLDSGERGPIYNRAPCCPVLSGVGYVRGKTHAQILGAVLVLLMQSTDSRESKESRVISDLQNLMSL